MTHSLPSTSTSTSTSTSANPSAPAAMAFLAPPPLIEGLRRLKAHLLKAAAHEGMAQLIGPLLDWNLTGETSRRWAIGHEEAVKTVKMTLAAAGMDMDSVMARTLALKIHEIERIDRMTMAAEARRNAVLREIERHRASFARTLRRTVEDVEAADVKMIAAPDAAPAEAA
jgi:hypothetical protein